MTEEVATLNTLLLETVQQLSDGKVIVANESKDTWHADLDALPFIPNLPVPHSYLATREGEAISKRAAALAHEMLMGWPFWKTFLIPTPRLMILMTGKPSMIPIRLRLDRKSLLKKKWKQLREAGDVEESRKLVDQIAQLGVEIDANIISTEETGFREWPMHISNAAAFQFYCRAKLLMEVTRFPRQLNQSEIAEKASAKLFFAWHEAEKGYLETQDIETSRLQFSRAVLSALEEWFFDVLSIHPKIVEALRAMEVATPPPPEKETPEVLRLEQLIHEQRLMLQPCLWRNDVKEAAVFKYMSEERMRAIAAKNSRCLFFSPKLADLDPERPLIQYFAPGLPGRFLIKTI